MKEIQFKSIGNRKFKIGNSLSLNPEIQSKENLVHLVQKSLALKCAPAVRRCAPVAQKCAPLRAEGIKMRAAARRGARKSMQIFIFRSKSKEAVKISV